MWSRVAATHVTAIAAALCAATACAPEPPLRPESGDGSGVFGLGPRIFVDAAAVAGGDGSAQAPFRHLSEAFADAAARAPDGGAVIRVAAGRYLAPDTPALPLELQLIGDGAGVTFLETGAAAATWSQADALALSGLSIDGVIRLSGDDLRVEGLVLDDASRLSLSGDAVDVRDVRSDGGRLAFERARLVSVQATTIEGGSLVALGVDALVVQGLQVRATDETALRLVDTSADLVDVGIEDIGTNGDRPAAVVVEGGALRARQFVVSSAHDTALEVTRGAAVWLNDFSIRGARSALIRLSDSSASLVDGSVLDAESGLVAENSDVELLRVEVADHEHTCIDLHGGTLIADEVSVSACRERGVHALIPRAVRIEQMRVAKVGGPCIELEVIEGPVQVRESTVTWCVYAGVRITGRLGDVDPQVRVESVDASHVDPGVDGERPAGVMLHGANAELKDLHVHDMAGWGVEGTEASLVVQESDFGALRGGVIVHSGTTEFSRIESNTFEAVRDAAVLVYDTQAEVLSNDIVDTRYGAMAGGAGVAVGLTENFVITGNSVAGSAGDGVLAFDGAVGYIAGNRLVQNGGFGIREDCPGPESSRVEIGGNEMISNRRGEISRCEETP